MNNTSSADNLKGPERVLSVQPQESSTPKVEVKVQDDLTKMSDIAHIGDYDDCPLFVRKTYFMVETCNVDVVQWSGDGKSFVIKDPDVFTSKIIPQFFKHNNLQSFIRQLNFYGFRKLKKEPIKLQSPKSHKCRQMHFRHNKFVRGCPELLSQIRGSRRNPPSPKDQKNVGVLKNEVNNMRECVKNLSSDIHSLKYLVNSIISRLDDMDREDNERSLKNSHQENLHTIEPRTSFSKSSEKYNATSSSNVNILNPSMISVAMMNQKSSSDGNSLVTKDCMNVNNARNKDYSGLKEIWPKKLSSSMDSFSFVDNEDVDFIQTIFCDDNKNSQNQFDFDATPYVSSASSEKMFASSTSKLDYNDQDIVRKYNESIGLLPPDLRHYFAKEKQLFSNVTDDNFLKQHVDTMFAFAKDITKQTQEQNSKPAIPSPLHNNIAGRAA